MTEALTYPSAGTGIGILGLERGRGGEVGTGGVENELTFTYLCSATDILTDLFLSLLTDGIYDVHAWCGLSMYFKYTQYMYV